MKPNHTFKSKITKLSKKSNSKRAKLRWITFQWNFHYISKSKFSINVAPGEIKKCGVKFKLTIFGNFSGTQQNDTVGWRSRVRWNQSRVRVARSKMARIFGPSYIYNPTTSSPPGTHARTHARSCLPINQIPILTPPNLYGTGLLDNDATNLVKKQARFEGVF